MELLEDFGVEVYPQYMEGNNKLIIDNLSDIRTYSGLIPKLGILELLDINRLMEKVRNCNCSYILFPKLSWPEYSKGTFCSLSQTASASTHSGIAQLICSSFNG